MDATKQLIIVNGKDKTDSIVSCQLRGSKCDVVYDNAPRVYSYNAKNVQILKPKQRIDPKSIIFKYKGVTITNIEQILDYGEFYRVVRSGKKDLSCRRA